MLGWLDPNTIEKTFEDTTQLARLPMGTMLKHAFKSGDLALNVVCYSKPMVCNIVQVVKSVDLALNVVCHPEPMACNIVHVDTPTIDNGSITAVVFVALMSKATEVNGIETGKQFINYLEDNIRGSGAPTKPVCDHTQVETSKKVKSTPCKLLVGECQSEPHQQQ